MQGDDFAPKSAELTSGKKKRTVGVGVCIAIAVVVGLGSFVAGSRTQEVLAFFGVEYVQSKSQGDLDLSSVHSIYQALRKQFDGDLDTQKLIDGAKKGMVDATGDPYTVYFTDEEAREFFNELDGTFSGIGAELGKKEGILTIVSTLDDSPARKNNLLAGDLIVKVNDQDTTGWSIDKAVSEIRGEKGTTVKLTILRDQEVKEFSIVRDAIVNPSVRYEVTPDNIGYLRISRFSDTDTVDLARKAAQEFKQKGVKGVVLDLRGNGGGYLGAAQDVTGIWLKDKVVVQEKRGDKVVETLRSDGNAVLGGVPTVVLIDEGSASASEIVAGALRDHQAAQLLGKKTFGKGSVQTIEEVSGGGQLKITIAKWYTPNGKNIDKEGIEPDISVEITKEDTAAGRDVQKQRAFEIFK